MYFYEFNIGDFAKKTQHLTNEEELAYRRALDLYYDTEKPLDTKNIPELSRRLRVGFEALQNVINEFFPDGKNKHADEKIAAYYEFLAKQSANGKKGGRPKNQQITEEKNPPLNDGIPTDNPPPSQPLTTKPLTTKPSTNIKYSDEFETFWKYYPNKTNKKKAYDLWLKLNPPLNAILKSLAWQAKSDKWTKDGGQYIPMPTTYLNGHGWEDEPLSVAKKLSTIEQIMGGRNGTNRQIIDITEINADQNDGAGIPEINDGIWEANAD